VGGANGDKLLGVAAGYSQNQVARLLGIDASLISRYESGARPMPKRLRKKLVKVCAKRVNWAPLLRAASR
jgi:transcriptional regulator with XRE-family HTH domain